MANQCKAIKKKKKEFICQFMKNVCLTLRRTKPNALPSVFFSIFVSRAEGGMSDGEGMF